MDPLDKIKQLEQHNQTLGQKVAEAETELQDALQNELERAQQLAEAQIEEYKKENRRYAKALQTIADGKGKYAKVARDAL